MQRDPVLAELGKTAQTAGEEWSLSPPLGSGPFCRRDFDTLAITDGTYGVGG